MNDAHRWTSIHLYHGGRPPHVHRASTKSQTNPGLSPPLISHYSTLRRHGGHSESESLAPPYARGSVPLSLASAIVSPRSTSLLRCTCTLWLRKGQAIAWKCPTGRSPTPPPSTQPQQHSAYAPHHHNTPHVPRRKRTPSSASTLTASSSPIALGRAAVACHVIQRILNPLFTSQTTPYTVPYAGPLPATDVVQGILNPSFMSRNDAIRLGAQRLSPRHPTDSKSLFAVKWHPMTRRAILTVPTSAKLPSRPSSGLSLEPSILKYTGVRCVPISSQMSTGAAPGAHPSVTSYRFRSASPNQGMIDSARHVI